MNAVAIVGPGAAAPSARPRWRRRSGPAGSRAAWPTATQSWACRSGSTASTAPFCSVTTSGRVELGAETQLLHRRQRLARFDVGEPGLAAAARTPDRAARGADESRPSRRAAAPARSRSSADSQLRLQRADQLVEIARPPVDRLEDHRHAVALVGVAGQPLEGADRRRRVARGRRAREDLGVAIDGARGVADPIRQDRPPGAAWPRPCPGRPARDRGWRSGDRPDRASGPACDSRRSSSAAALRIGRIDLQRLAQRPDGAVGVVQLLLVELGAAAEQRHPGRGIDRPAGLLVDELAQIAPGAPALERRFVELRASRLSSGRASNRRR